MDLQNELSAGFCQAAMTSLRLRRGTTSAAIVLVVNLKKRNSLHIKVYINCVCF